MRKWLGKMGAVAAAVLAAAPRVVAQGCAMCYADASAQSPRAKHMLDLAILTLLVPSVLLFGGVLVAAFRRRARDRAYEEGESVVVRPPRPASPRAGNLPATDALL